MRDGPGPSDCLHTMHGYRLYAVDGKPVVIHRWTTREKDAEGDCQGVDHEERGDLTGEVFHPGVNGDEARTALTQAWNDWQEWTKAMVSP